MIPTRHPDHPLTIGLLTNDRSGPQMFDLWSGVVDEARANNIRLISFSRREFIGQKSAAQEALYSIIRPKRLDGLIVACTLAAFSGEPDSIRQFLAQFSPVPIVSYGVVLDDIPGVLIDNYGGTRAAMQHIIQDHQCRRIGFLFGEGDTYDLSLRYQAYSDTLAAHNIPVNPDLVVTTEQWMSAEDAAYLLFDQRRQRLDAVIASNDATALEFMTVLQQRGLRVPDDVAVIGFDYSEAGQVVTPPLTTIPLRAYERGRRTVRIILDMLAGNDIPQQVLVDTKLVVRESCGCVTPSLVWAKTGGIIVERDNAVTAHNLYDTLLTTQREHIEELILQAIGNFRIEAHAVRQLLDGFVAELELGNENQTVGPFLQTLETVLQETQGTGQVLSSWQNAVSAMRYWVLPYFHTPPTVAYVESLFQQARVLIGERARRAQAFQGWQAEQQANLLHEIGQRLTATPELAYIIALLTSELPNLGIPRCYLAIYDQPDLESQWATLLLAYDEDDPVEHPPYRFRADELVPDAITGFNRADAMSLAVEPLFFQDEQLGYVIFELGPRDGRLYEVLAMQLSSALLVSNLMRRNVRLYHEALEAQRQAEQADQLKSRFLAMVSHELRTPLLSLVGLSEMLLHDDLVEGTSSLDDQREDLKHIHYSAQQLDGLIRDVLDLSLSQVGQLKLSKSAVDMWTMLETVAATGLQMARQKGLQWQVDLPDTLPLVWGDQTRLQQVALNLIINAVKFTDQGEVRLAVELSPDQAEIMILVSDTGLGIPPQDRAAVFDEFHQSSRTIEQGFGGLGLGLAICQHLVELHEGEIGIRESGRTGSVFYVTLPTLDQDFTDLAKRDGIDVPITLDYLSKPIQGNRLAQVLAQQRLNRSSDNPLILIVDDEPGILRANVALVQRYLPQCQIITATHGREALSVIQAEIPDLILLDLVMPEMDGFAVLDALREDERTRRVPVIVLTAQTLTDADLVQMNERVSAILAKDIFSDDETIAHVEAALTNSKTLGSETQRIVRQGMTYIQHHYANPITRQDIALHVGVSEGHLTRSFRQELGITPLTYLNRYRIRQAKTLLEQSTNSITEVAVAVGYSDSSYFSRVFRRETGVSPSEYRNGKHTPYQET